MNEVPDIINTEIINSNRDIFWNEIADIQSFTQKPVLVISSNYLNATAEDEQLLSIIKAGCKLQETQYNIIQLKESEEVAWFKIREQIQPKVILLFNILPAQLGISALFNFNEVNNFDGKYWVPTLSLTALIQDKTSKGKLWNGALKPLFETRSYGEII